MTRHGENAVVVVAYRDFAEAEPTEDFKSFLTSVPLAEFDRKRTPRLPRKTAL